MRPGSLTGKHVDPVAVAFVFALHPYDGDEADIRMSPEDRRLILWPAAMGHEQVADRESALRAMFGPDYQEATRDANHEHGGGIAYDAVELRRLAVQKNLFGRYGRIRGVRCLMLWNRCEGWEVMTDKLPVLLDVPDDGVVTMGSREQWWVKE